MEEISHSLLVYVILLFYVIQMVILYFTGYVQLLFNWPVLKFDPRKTFLCDRANQRIGSLFLLCGIIPHHKQLRGAEVLFCLMSNWRSINSAFEMAVREVLLCCSASIPYKGSSVWVQNGISCHL